MSRSKDRSVRFDLRRLAGALVSLTLALAGCAQSQSDPALPAPPLPTQTTVTRAAVLSDEQVHKMADDANVKAISAANNDFGFRLLAKLDQANAGQNVFFSPLSIESALMMTMSGAAGQTQAEMAKTLGVGSLSVPETNQGYATLL